MIKRHLANVLTYFRHRITKAMSEGLHAGKIQGSLPRAHPLSSQMRRKGSCGYGVGEPTQTASSARQQGRGHQRQHQGYVMPATQTA